MSIHRKIRKLLRDPGKFVRDSRFLSHLLPASMVDRISGEGKWAVSKARSRGQIARAALEEVKESAPRLHHDMMAAELFRTPLGERELPPRVVVAGEPKHWDDARARCRKDGAEIVAYLNWTGSYLEDECGGIKVFRSSDDAELPQVPVLFASPPRKSDFLASPPSAQRCLWLHPPVGWRLRPRDVVKLAVGNAEKLERVHETLEDDESRMTMAGVVRSWLESDSGYVRVAPYIEYDHPVVGAAPGDIVIDGGSFDGHVALRFARSVGDDGKVFAMEPDPSNFERLCGMAGEQPNISPQPKGLWSEPTTLRFSSEGGGASQINDEGEVKIDVTSIDTLVAEQGLERLDMIKLDVEGAEEAVLEGAWASIERFRPKLLISIYHKPEDLFEIPLAIASRLENYRFWMGNNNYYHTEIDLYAMPIERLP